MKTQSTTQTQFARCPRCNAVVKFEPGSTKTSCIKCGVRINRK